MTKKIFSGTGTAIVTPFRKDGSIDFNSFEKLIEFQITGGIDYLVVLGTTGESVTISTDEKHAIINFVVEKVNKRVPIVVGCGGNNTADIINGIEEIDFEGVDGLLSVTPYYNKPSQEGIFQHFKAVAAVCPVPVIIYNVPGRTGVNMTAATTLRLANVKNIVAVKEASGNMPQIMEIIRNKPADFMVISGDDALTIPVIVMGGDGIISVISNGFPKEFSAMTKKALKQDFKVAAEISLQILPLINAIFEEGSPCGIKTILNQMGIIEGYLRLPLVPVSADHAEKLEKLTAEFKKQGK